MYKQLCKSARPLGMALMVFAMMWAEEGRGEDLVVTRETPVVYEMNGGAAKDIKTFETITVHGSLSINRLGANTGELGVTNTLTGSLNLGPSEGDVGSIAIYNESWVASRGKLETQLVKVGENGGWGTVNVEGGLARMMRVEICEAAAVPENAVFLTLSRKNVSGSFFSTRSTI